MLFTRTVYLFKLQILYLILQGTCSASFWYVPALFNFEQIEFESYNDDDDEDDEGEAEEDNDMICCDLNGWFYGKKKDFENLLKDNYIPCSNVRPSAAFHEQMLHFAETLYTVSLLSFTLIWQAFINFWPKKPSRNLYKLLFKR